MWQGKASPHEKKAKAPRPVTTVREVVAFYRANQIEVRLERTPPGAVDQPEEWQHSYVLIISYNTTLIVLPLGDMTLEELEMMGDVFDLALFFAKPVAALRDVLVQEAVSKGDYSFTRMYRGIPNVVVPEEHVKAHFERLRRRRTGVLPGQQPDGSGSQSARERGGGLDEPDGQALGGEDNAAKDDIVP